MPGRQVSSATVTNPVAFGALEITLPEVKELTSFLDGSIMVPEVRHHLWRSWGFCQRHTWLYATTEIETRGGRPFGTSILYADLVGRAAATLEQGSHPLPWPVVRWRLTTHDTCFTCDYVAGVRGQGDPACRPAQDRINRRDRTVKLIAESADLWCRLACPECLGGEGMTCRPHLLAAQDEPADRAGLARALRNLEQRLARFEKSMTWRGPAVRPAERTSWIEALGWFAGWSYTAAVSGRGI